jgi:inhibitor of KinA
MTDTINVKILTESECSVVMTFGDEINEHIFEVIMDMNARIHANPFPGWVETVPAYTTLTIFYDSLTVIGAAGLEGNNAFDRVINFLNELPPTGYQRHMIQPHPPMVIPVCYGGNSGPDIEFVAAHNKLSVSEVIAIHTEAIYTVHMLGFMPGFPYLGGMDKRLTTPRRDTPRKLVEAGTVAIAAGQTGIYPLDSPGGWQLIGKTPMTLFDPFDTKPTLLRAGDRVKFAVISEAEFLVLSE